MDTDTTNLLHDLKKIVHLWNQVKVAMDDFMIHYLESKQEGVQDGRSDRVDHSKLGSAGSRAMAAGAASKGDLHIDTLEVG